MPDNEKLARKRSHNDTKTANDNARAVAQAVIIINGGAATAILAFAARGSPTAAPLVAHAISIALVGYAAGVLLGAVMMFCATKYMQMWSEYWTNLAQGRSWDEVSWLHAQGLVWMRRSNRCFFAGMSLFAISTCLVAAGITTT